MHIAIFKQVVQLVFVLLYDIVSLIDFFLMFLQVECHVTLRCHISGCHNIVAQLVILVRDCAYLEFDVFVDVQIGVVHVLPGKEREAARWIELSFEEWNVEHTLLAEELLALFIKLTEFSHLLINIDEYAVAVVERHGYEIGLKHALVDATSLTDEALLVDILCQILGGIDDTLASSVIGLYDAIAIVLPDIRVLGCTRIEAQEHIKTIGLSLDEAEVVLVQYLLLARPHAVQEFLGIHAGLWQHVTIVVRQDVSGHIVFYDVVVTHIECHRHHLVQFGRLVHGSLDTGADQFTEKQSDDACDDDTNEDDKCDG